MHRALKLFLTLALLVTTIITNGHAQAGNSGLAFLKLGIAGRAMAMGEATAGSISGAAATFYNPAGLVGTSSPFENQLMFMHKEWIQDTRTEFLGASIALGSMNSIGFSLISTTTSDIEIRTRPGIPEGTFTSRNFCLGASYAHALSDELTIGLTAKYLYQKILVDESTGFAFDIGGQYHTSIENLSIGAAIANLGSMGGLRSGSTQLPSLLRIGPAYAYDVEGLNARLTLGSDLLYILPERKSYVNAGGELMFNQAIAARLGYQFGSEARGLGAGIGIQHGIFKVDYAFNHVAADLGDAHTFSISLDL